MLKKQIFSCAVVLVMSLMTAVMRQQTSLMINFKGCAKWTSNYS
jgi:hypothetical protein